MLPCWCQLCQVTLELPPLSASSAKLQTRYLITLGSFPILCGKPTIIRDNPFDTGSQVLCLKQCPMCLNPCQKYTYGAYFEHQVNIICSSSAHLLPSLQRQQQSIAACKQTAINHPNKIFPCKVVFLLGKGYCWRNHHIEKIATDLQQANYLTKGLAQVPFKCIWQLVQGW